MSKQVDVLDSLLLLVHKRQLEARRTAGAQSGVTNFPERPYVKRHYVPQNNSIEDLDNQSNAHCASEQYSELAVSSEQPVKQNFVRKPKSARSSIKDRGSLGPSTPPCNASIPVEEKFFDPQPILKTKGNYLESSTVHGSFEEFSNDLLSILDDASSSDVAIKCGIDVLKVHKNILSARSPVFKAMFSTSMRENAEGTVSIDDIDPTIVRDLLTFIYSNRVQDLSVPKACDLLNAAEKYELQALKRICVDFLMRNLSVANAFFILQEADLYDESLKSHTIEFISKKFSDLKVSEEWKAVQSRNPTLALEVLNAIVEQFT